MLVERSVPERMEPESCTSLTEEQPEEQTRGRWNGQPRARTPTQAGEQHPSAGAPGRPSRAPSCPCSPGQARVSATVDAPSRLPEEGPVPAPQLLSPSSHDPTAVRAPAALTSDDNARQRPQRQQSGPELSRPPRSHPVHRPSRRARATASWRPRLLFLPGRGGDAVGGTQRGGPRAKVPSLRRPPGPCLRLRV